jgi:hypothetical protein
MDWPTTEARDEELDRILAQMVPRPDPAEVRKAVDKVKRLVKTQQKSCRRHGLTEEIVEAEAALLKLVGVEGES